MLCLDFRCVLLYWYRYCNDIIENFLSLLPLSVSPDRHCPFTWVSFGLAPSSKNIHKDCSLNTIKLAHVHLPNFKLDAISPDSPRKKVTSSFASVDGPGNFRFYFLETIVSQTVYFFEISFTWVHFSVWWWIACLGAPGSVFKWSPQDFWVETTYLFYI